MPKNTVYVGRPTKWGNPYHEGQMELGHPATRGEALYHYSELMRHEDLSELRGKNLACWCKIGEPCHADFLLRFANE